MNTSASKKADSDQDSMVSDHFYTSSGKIVQRPRKWCNVDLSSDIQIEGFKQLFKVESTIPEPKSDDKITVCSNLDKVGFVVDMGGKEEPNGYWEVLTGPNGQVGSKR
jgi:hypothetical protein